MLVPSPAPAASLQADPSRLMSPISASRTSAVYGPAPGSPVSALKAGSDLARWCTCQSSRAGRLLQSVGQRQAIR